MKRAVLERTADFHFAKCNEALCQIWKSPLLFDLLVGSLRPTPLAPLLELNLALHELLIFAGEIVNTLAVLACQLDELFLCHKLI